MESAIALSLLALFLKKVRQHFINVLRGVQPDTKTAVGNAKLTEERTLPSSMNVRIF